MVKTSPLTKSKYLFIVGGIWIGISIFVSLIICFGLFLSIPLVENHTSNKYAIKTSDLNKTGTPATATITELYHENKQCKTDVLGGVWFTICDKGMVEFEANGSKYQAPLRVVESPDYYKYNYNKGDTVEILYDAVTLSRITIKKDKYNLWVWNVTEQVIHPSYELINTIYRLNLIICALIFLIGCIALAFGAKLKRTP